MSCCSASLRGGAGCIKRRSSRVCVSTGREWRVRYVDFCMRFVKLLLDAGVTPVVVFDGGDLPTKAAENERRRE